MTAIFISLVLLDALLLWTLIRTHRGWWAPKAIGIVGVLAFNLLVWNASGSFTGWSASGDLVGELKSCIVNEDDQEVYLWIVPGAVDGSNPFSYRPKPSEPRSVRAPYTRELHELCETSSAAQSRGVRVGIRSRSSKLQRQVRRGRYVLYRLPPPRPRLKEAS